MKKLLTYILTSFIFSLNANTLGVDMNDFLCAIVGENLMNGNPESFDKMSCRKLPEYDESYTPKKKNNNFCEINTEDGTAKLSYGDIPASVNERYANRKYTGWSGGVKMLEDKIDIGIGIMRELKDCNVKVSQNYNEFMKRAAIKGFDKVSFLYEGSDNVLATAEAVAEFFESSLDIFDCNYNCDVHKEFNGGKMSGSELLQSIRSGDFSLNNIQDNRLYKICKSSQSLCLGAGVDTKELSDRLREKLGLRNDEGTGFVDKVERTRDDLIKKIRENKLLNNTDRIDLLNIQKEYNSMVFGQVADGIDTMSINNVQDTFSNLKSKASTCDAPSAKTTFNLPDLGYCDLDAFDSDFVDNRLKQLEDQIRNFKDNAMRVLMSQVAAIVQNSLSNIIMIAKSLELEKSLMCLPTAFLRGSLTAGQLSPEQMNVFNEKGAECLEGMQKWAGEFDFSSGVRWLTKITPKGPKIIPWANPTTGAGVTLHPEEQIASASEWGSCLMSGMSAVVQSEYQKCMKGDGGINSIEFFKNLKYDLIPELKRVKAMQCNLDKQDSLMDYFDLLDKAIDDNFNLIEASEQTKYKLAVRDEILNSANEDLSKMLANRSRNPHNEESIVLLFLKEKVRTCMNEEMDNLELKQTEEGRRLTKKKLDVMQNTCMDVKFNSGNISINNRMNVIIAREGGNVVFTVNSGNNVANNKVYKVKYNRLQELQKIIKMELGLNYIDLENKLYSEIYSSDDKSIELFMDYYNSEDGIRKELFNKHLLKIEKKIKEIKHVDYKNDKVRLVRKSAIQKIIKRCGKANLSERIKEECSQFKGHESELKTYGGILNDK